MKAFIHKSTIQLGHYTWNINNLDQHPKQGVPIFDLDNFDILVEDEKFRVKVREKFLSAVFTSKTFEEVGMNMPKLAVVVLGKDTVDYLSFTDPADEAAFLLWSSDGVDI